MQKTVSIIYVLLIYIKGLLFVAIFQSGRKETVLDLAKFVDKGVQVKLTGGRQGRLGFSFFLTFPEA